MLRYRQSTLTPFGSFTIALSLIYRQPLVLFWTVIKSDCKKRARLNAMRYVLNRLPYSKRDLGRIGSVDPLIVGRPSLVPSKGDHQLAGGHAETADR